MPRQPLCFVLMSFGVKPDGSGGTIDFDAVYHDVIQPAILDAQLDPLRADEEVAGGIIHKPMFERLLLCPFAVADLTSANANVFYELGVRHAVRPATTVTLFAEGGRLPFDVAPLRALPYRLSNSRPANPADARAALAKRLIAAKRMVAENDPDAVDSPLFQLLEDYPNIAHTKTDEFRERVQYADDIKEALANAREEGVEAVRAVDAKIDDLYAVESAVLIDLLLSYRAVRAWREMVELVKRMPKPVAQTVLVQEQLALALNRYGEDDDAERILTSLIETRGPSSETCALLGRVYKDRWERAKNGGDRLLAKGLLEKAIGAYLRGFETDWRDSLPGINAVTLMELKDKPDPRQSELLPVIMYTTRRVIATRPDYWAYASLLELYILGRDPRAEEALADALAAVREKWEPETTARNLRLILDARTRRGEDVGTLQEIIAALDKAAR
jgi:tetratricopeptide (TPR) repeat protein